MGEVKSNQPISPKRIGIVGTGPASLLKAWFISQRYPESDITLLDSGLQPGGAWYSDHSPGGSEIECGCHIWSYAPVAFNFIEKELGVKLYPMSPPPVFIGKWGSLPYSLKNTLDTYRTFFGKAIRFKFGELSEFNKRPYAHYKPFGKPNKYPKSGSPELIHALLKKLETTDRIKILLNTKLTRLTVNDKVLIESDTQKLEFDHIYLTYVSNLEKADLNGTIYTPQPRQVDYIHFLLQLNKPLCKKISYWRLMNDPIVHRFTDISYQTENREHLILVGIKDKSFHGESSEKLLNYVKDLMLKLKLTDASHQVELIKTHIFPTFYMNRELYAELRNFPKQISVIHSTDLMYGLHYILEEETPHLTQTPK